MLSRKIGFFTRYSTKLDLYFSDFAMIYYRFYKFLRFGS
jgi:hypothetical protein